METANSIHTFWFGTDADDAAVAAGRAPLWWRKQPETDRLILQRFASCVHQAAEGSLDHWAETASGRLALILLTDRFPRIRKSKLMIANT